VKALPMLKERVERPPTAMISVLSDLATLAVDKRTVSASTPTEKTGDDKMVVASKGKEFTVSELYFAVVMIRDSLHQLSVSELKSEHLKYLYVDDPIFKARIGQFKDILTMVRNQCGFGSLRGGKGMERVLVFDNASLLGESDASKATDAAVLRRLNFMLEDIDLIVRKQIRPRLPMVKLHGQQNMSNSTSKLEIASFYKFLLKAINRIIDEPLEGKWRRPLAISKIKGKWSSVVGVKSILRVHGFRPDASQDDPKYSFADTNPVNLHLLGMNRDVLQAVHDSVPQPASF
jgi:hypothetical protein